MGTEQQLNLTGGDISWHNRHDRACTAHRTGNPVCTTVLVMANSLHPVAGLAAGCISREKVYTYGQIFSQGIDKYRQRPIMDSSEHCALINILLKRSRLVTGGVSVFPGSLHPGGAQAKKIPRPCLGWKNWAGAYPAGPAVGRGVCPVSRGRLSAGQRQPEPPGWGAEYCRQR